MTATTSMDPAGGDNTAIRPLEVGFSEAELADLRKRISTTRWPERETVSDDSQGVPLQTMQDLARYWATDYDWRKCEARLNGLPNFVTEIDGLEHTFHSRSLPARGCAAADRDERVACSYSSSLKIIKPLANPPRRRECLGRISSGDPVAAGAWGRLSGKPTATGWDTGSTARASWRCLRSAGDEQFVAQGGDTGRGGHADDGHSASSRDCSASIPTCRGPRGGYLVKDV